MTPTVAAGTALVALVADPLLEGALRDLAAVQYGLLTTGQLAEHGLTPTVISDRVTRKRWRRGTRGVYDVGLLLPAELPHDVRGRRAAVLGLLAYGPTAIAVGGSALRLRGVWGVPPGRPPEVALPEAGARRSRNGLRCRRFRPDDVVEIVDGWRVEGAVRALAQLVVEVRPGVALGILDSALHRGVIDAAQLAEVRALVAGRRGARAIAPVWELVDGRRESPLESWACFDLAEVGLSPTDVQVEIRDGRGDFVARGDLGYDLGDGSWLLVELDGAEHHLGQAEVVADHRRQNGLALTRRVILLRYVNEDRRSGRMRREIGAFLAGRAWRRP